MVANDVGSVNGPNVQGSAGKRLPPSLTSKKTKGRLSSIEHKLHWLAGLGSDGLQLALRNPVKGHLLQPEVLLEEMTFLCRLLDQSQAAEKVRRRHKFRSIQVGQISYYNVSKF
jgi:hypothetical protein